MAWPGSADFPAPTANMQMHAGIGQGALVGTWLVYVWLGLRACLFSCVKSSSILGHLFENLNEI